MEKFDNEAMKKSDNEAMEKSDNEENFSDAVVPLQKLKKERISKLRTEKQLEHFKRMAEKRRENIEKKKLEKKIEASKLLLEHSPSISPPQKALPPQKTKKSPQPMMIQIHRLKKLL